MTDDLRALIDPHALRTLIEQLIDYIKDADCCYGGSCQLGEVEQRLGAVLSALPETPWQPIETAPKANAREILAAWFYPEGQSGQHAQCIQRVVWWSRADDCWWGPDGAKPQPTHWMPLPAPPPPSEEPER